MRIKNLFILFFVLGFMLSCQGALNVSKESMVYLRLGSPRAYIDPVLEPSTSDFSTWPLGKGMLPVFSNIKVTVSGPGMVNQNTFYTGSSDIIEVPVAYGTDRKIYVSAEADWAATGALYKNTEKLNTLAVSYSGSQVIPLVSSDSKISISIPLYLESTKILIPESETSNSFLNSTDNFASTQLSTEYKNIQNSSYFVFDPFGRLFVYFDTKIYAFSNLANVLGVLQVNPAYTVRAMAYEQKKQRLYFIYENQDSNKALGLFDLADKHDESYNLYNIDFGTSGIYILSNSLAVDDEGYLYFYGYRQVQQETSYGLFRSKVEKGAEGYFLADEYPQLFSPESLKLGYYENITGTQNFMAAHDESNSEPLIIEDMTYKAGRLFILLAQQMSETNVDNMPIVQASEDELFSRGKLVVLDTASMAFIKESGWSDSPYMQEADKPDKLYGPKRFVGFNKDKLYFVDEGFSWSGSSGANLTNVDRVIEVDSSSLSGFNTGLKNISAFYHDYSEIEVNQPY